MVDLIFYEKPGCITNAKQKQLLKKAGIEILVLDLIQQDWSKEALLPFFESLVVPQWFNQNAPQVKSGEIIPEKLSAEEAIQMMLANPILIRRPLIHCKAEKWCGFEWTRIARTLGIENILADSTVSESCSNTNNSG